MSKIEDGGPVLPHDGALYITLPGMYLRDYFAGQVLASAAALPYGQSDYEHRAQVAYAMADSMLAARKEGRAS